MNIRLLALIGVTSLLAACAAATPRYYTLQEPVKASSLPAGPKPAWQGFELRRLEVPAQLDRRALVLTEPNQGQISLLNDNQWASPLSDELALSLSSGLQARLGVPQLARGSTQSPLWQIDVLVQRFESVYGQQANLALAWVLTPVGFEAKPVQCSWVGTEPAGSVVELIQAHRQLQARWLDILAAQMRSADLPDTAVNSLSCTG